MTAVETVLKGAPIIDFTGSVAGARQVASFGEAFIKLIRAEKRPEAIVIIDRAVGMPIDAPVVVTDHLNLTGTSPLLGPNDPCGERFPVVQGIYITDVLPSLKRAVIGGIKDGIKLDADDVRFLQTLNVQTCCYNLASAMLIAAHAKCRVLGLVVPETGLPTGVREQVEALIGGNR